MKGRKSDKEKVNGEEKSNYISSSMIQNTNNFSTENETIRTTYSGLCIHGFI